MECYNLTDLLIFNLVKDIKELSKLYEEGLLTKEEFTKAKEKLGWEPKITLEEMVHEMMENDINIAKRDSLVKEHGYKAPDFNE